MRKEHFWAVLLLTALVERDRRRVRAWWARPPLPSGARRVCSSTNLHPDLWPDVALTQECAPIRSSPVLRRVRVLLKGFVRVAPHLDGLRAGAASITVGLILLGACSSPSSTEKRAAIDAAIVNGWKSALNAYDNAARQGHWDSHALAASFNSPLLQSVENNLHRIDEAGDIAIGNTRVLRVAVIHADQYVAMVSGCVQDNEIVVSKFTKEPVPGILGRADEETFEAVLRKHFSVWKVASQSVAEGTCAAN
jgi:hypothetical protein